MHFGIPIPNFRRWVFRCTSSIKKVTNSNGGGASTAEGEDGTEKRKLAWRSQQPTFFFLTVFFSSSSSAFHSFPNWGWRVFGPRLFCNRVQEKGAHSNSHHVPMRGWWRS
ncbi:hypothetical protein CDAR_620211 [Caerostris darwini]|uniref:Uncharacterized protein n=1 Tax=Caerostris darwini TaxID=1538125 RepID=A0AAV4VK69_9ARAC|nr:hypothetical protein CDAR_620211 [Caerostris darwini]